MTTEAVPHAQPMPRSRPHHGAIRLWLFAIAALIFAMVMVGGATRLTESGLSITEWQPILGAIPPLSDADWQAAFDKYRQIPQYTQLNEGMSLAAFKVIYWWEWTHRFLGRFIGVAFLLPLAWFWLRGALDGGLVARLMAIFVLGGAQGLLGWYMVQSGLSERVDVSQYRLAAHLGLAVLILGAVLWAALGLGGAVRGGRRWSAAALSAAGLTALIFVQIMLGALVAGLDAGLSHNTWPLMDGRLIPDGLGAMSPWYVNPFENVLTVQFDHRLTAYAIALWAAVHGVWLWRRGATVSAALLVLGVIGQIALGVATLLASVPIGLALAHQAAAIGLFSLGLYHLHRLRQEPA